MVLLNTNTSSLIIIQELNWCCVQKIKGTTVQVWPSQSRAGRALWCAPVCKQWEAAGESTVFECLLVRLDVCAALSWKYTSTLKDECVYAADYNKDVSLFTTFFSTKPPDLSVSMSVSSVCSLSWISTNVSSLVYCGTDDLL